MRRRDRSALWPAALAFGVVGVLVGVGSGTQWYGLLGPRVAGPCPTGTTLQGAGASFPSALFSQWSEGYAAFTSNQVNYAPSGAGEGVTLLTDKQVDFAATDEPLNGTESTALTGAVGSVLTLPATGGAISLVYTLPGYSGRLNLTPAELAGIYNGSITTWDSSMLVANNPSLHGFSAPIFAVHRTDQAGMSYVLTNLLSDDNVAWRAGPGTSIQPDWPSFPGAIGESGNSGLIKEVAKQAGAIGYTDLYDTEINRLPSAFLENPHGNYIAPAVASTRSAVDDVYNASPGSFPASNASWAGVSFVNAPGPGDYPLAALVYLLVPQDPANGHTPSAAAAAVLVQWLHWALTSGESFDSTGFPFVNPPSPLVAEALGALSSMSFQGAPIPTCW